MPRYVKEMYVNKKIYHHSQFDAQHAQYYLKFNEYYNNAQIIMFQRSATLQNKALEHNRELARKGTP